MIKVENTGCVKRLRKFTCNFVITYNAIPFCIHTVLLITIKFQFGDHEIRNARQEFVMEMRSLYFH